MQNTRDDRRGRSRNGGRPGRGETQRKGSGAWFCEFLTGHDLSVPETAHNQLGFRLAMEWTRSDFTGSAGKRQTMAGSADSGPEPCDAVHGEGGRQTEELLTAAVHWRSECLLATVV